ncbi:hypothetical protein [Chryseobacterium oryctis]|uniref:Uncharacterized protein n=1 Tax=Chryseobacterium oryctis TaxID=2952618 RepID=A0ABT3HRN3_9FLAO|nr:hypothetical protein [Chryseobacterium oryctis]MCW3162442.1 hypothetical protein [Chryseobacterium oryctis]
MKQNQFIEKLEKIAKENIKIEDVEKVVQTKPVLSSLEENYVEILQKATIDIDEDYKKQLSILQEAVDFMYWKIEDEKAAVRIAGIWWDIKEKAHVFFARIYAP